MFRETPLNGLCVVWYEAEPKRDGLLALYSIHKTGIYLYTTTDRKPMYVGRAEDLEKRFQEHLSDNEPNKELLNFLRTQPARLYYAIEEDEDFRSGMELFLFNYLCPWFNDNTPSAKREISVNLPDGVTSL